MENKSKGAEKLFKKIARKSGVTMRDSKMLESDDHILVGVSGGKDSLIMLEVLANRLSAVPFPFKITAAHINILDAGYLTNTSKLKDFCKQLNVELIIREAGIDTNNGKAMCYNCSNLRRKILFDLTNELNCNKLAMGHHRQDAIETLLINMIYHGSISSLPKKLKMFNGRIELIRPLIDLDENLLKEYAEIKKLKFEEQACAFENKNQRIKIRNLIETIETMHGRGSYNMYRSMGKIFNEYLPVNKNPGEV